MKTITAVTLTLLLTISTLNALAGSGSYNSTYQSLDQFSQNRLMQEKDIQQQMRDAERERQRQMDNAYRQLEIDQQRMRDQEAFNSRMRDSLSNPYSR